VFDGVKFIPLYQANSSLYIWKTECNQLVLLRVHKFVTWLASLEIDTTQVQVVHQVIVTTTFCALVQVGAIACVRLFVHHQLVCVAPLAQVVHQAHTVQFASDVSHGFSI
jgi:poly-beta-hydroxyalkanoate depolymerase